VVGGGPSIDCVRGRSWREVNGDHPLVDEDHADVHGAPFRVSAASADYVRRMWSRQKVLVIGRHQFDLTNG
jgi:hypothetical protein